MSALYIFKSNGNPRVTLNTLERDVLCKQKYKAICVEFKKRRKQEKRAGRPLRFDYRPTTLVFY